MKIHVKLFAAARDIVDAENVELDVDPPATIKAIRQELCDQHPALLPLVGVSMFAVDTQYVADDVEVPAGAEVACIPPVSGG